MRRFIKERTFKGTCNLEFGSREEAEEFLKKKVIFAGVELTDKEFGQYALFLGYGLMEDGAVEWPWVIRELYKREE